MLQFQGDEVGDFVGCPPDLHVVMLRVLFLTQNIQERSLLLGKVVYI